MLVCHCWGNLAEVGSHSGCEPLLMSPWEADRYPSGQRPESFPHVCPCDCRECRRAWWIVGRPIIRDGRVVFAK